MSDVTIFKLSGLNSSNWSKIHVKGKKNSQTSNISNILYGKLKTPNTLLSGNIISWSSIQYATSYNVYNGTNLIDNTTNNSYDLSTIQLEEGTYTFYITAVDDNNIYTESNKSSGKSYKKYNPYLTFSSLNTFTLQVYDNQKYWNGTLEYSTDKNTWNTWSGTTTLSSTQSGDTKYYLFLRGTNNTYITGDSASQSQAYWKFSGTRISCTGNIENLLDYQTVANNQHPTMASCCYKHMFYNCTELILPPELPATTLTTWCYSNMFYNCTKLSTTPILPATDVPSHGYYGMFMQCQSITSTPNLPATHLADSCYAFMFASCTNLTTTINELAPSVYGSKCYYYMFSGCTALTKAPKISNATLTESLCMCMFRGCTSLTTPAIMSTKLAVVGKQCCYQMYYECTKLKIYTSSSGRTAFYKSISYSETSTDTNYQSSYRMFYDCYVNSTQSTADYLTAGTQYYY